MNRLFQTLLWTALLLSVSGKPVQAETSKMLATFSGMNHWTARALNFDGVITPPNTDPNSCNDACKGVDLDNLIQDVLDSHSNTYFYTMLGRDKFWAMFPQFLDTLYSKDPTIKVYAQFMPVDFMEFEGDMVARTQEIAVLAKTHPNLVGVQIDDYDMVHHENPDVYSVAHLQAMRDKLDGTYSNGRRLKLLVTAYYRTAGKEHSMIFNPARLKAFEINNGTEYVFDGITFPILWSTNAYGNGCFGCGIIYADDIPYQIAQVKNAMLPGTEIYPLLYATGYDASRNSNLQYLRDATEYAMNLSDGVIMYRLHTDYMGTWTGKNVLFDEKRLLIPELFQAYEAQQLASVKSCGFWDCSSQITFNGQSFSFSNAWGMMVIDPATKTVVSKTSYNTHNVVTEGAKMVTDMENIPFGHLVIIGTQDEPSENADNVRQGLCLNFGACTYQSNIGWRSMYYMIGYKGQTSPISEKYKAYSWGVVNALSSGSDLHDFVAPQTNIASVKSCGFWDCASKLTFNEHTLNAGTSWNIMVVDPVTKKVINQGSYNVHGDYNESVRLVNDLSNIPFGHLLIVGTHNEPYVNSSAVQQHLCQYFAACSHYNSIGYRSMYYMMGIKGKSPIAEGYKGYEPYTGEINSISSGYKAIDF